MPRAWVPNMPCLVLLQFVVVRPGQSWRGVGRFDFPKSSLIFAPGVSMILFCIKKDLGEVSNLRNKNCLDAKKVILYSTNGKISKNHDFTYNTTGYFAFRQFLASGSDTSPKSF